MTIAAPTILGSRSFPGISVSSVPGNLEWNDDGQAAFFTSRGVVILTPHLISSLPPPPAYLDPNLNIEHPSRKIGDFRRSEAAASKANGDESDGMDVADDGENAEAGPSNSGTQAYRRIRRPKNGEIGWYSNGLNTKDVDRAEIYEWTDVGDEFSASVSEDEIGPRAIAWSPSGLSDLGRCVYYPGLVSEHPSEDRIAEALSCLLAIMTSQGQVSVHAPFSDPYSKRWEEIADLTILTRAALPKQLSQPLTTPGMLQMRAVCMQWSRNLPLDHTLGLDTSVLAIANRAGEITFWSRFEQVLGVEVTEGWVIAMDWRPWIKTTETTCTAELALSCSDGSITVLQVQQSVNLTMDGQVVREVQVIGDESVVDKDTRAITGMRWIGDLLVYTRTGSVVIYSSKETDTIRWTGCRRIVLPQIGNWAGANPFAACVGIHSVSSDALLIVLSSQCYFIIADLHTSPRLAYSSDHLNLSIAARQVFLDHTQASMFDRKTAASQDKNIRNLTTHTGSWSGLGEAGLFSWFGEVINFHSMEFSPDGQRRTTLTVADMGGLVPERRSIIDDLEALLENPPTVAHISPLKLLLPHVLRILAAPDQIGISSELLDLLSSDAHEDAAPSAPEAMQRTDADIKLRTGLWGLRELAILRVRYTLARWCASHFKHSAPQFTTLATSALRAIQQIIGRLQLGWAASKIGGSSDLEQDVAFLQLVQKAVPDYQNQALAQAIKDANEGEDASGGADDVDACPACGTDVSPGDVTGTSRCKKGHEWSERDSTTRPQH